MSEEADTTIANFTFAYFIVAIFNGILVILKEENEGLFNWMASIPPWNHHWATHGLIVILLFFILGYAFKALNLDEKVGKDYSTLTKYLVVGTLIGILEIMGFFFAHAFL